MISNVKKNKEDNKRYILVDCENTQHKIYWGCINLNVKIMPILFGGGEHWAHFIIDVIHLLAF